MRALRSILLTLVLCFLLAIMAGCGAVVVGSAAAVGTYAYMENEATGTYGATIERAFEASVAACKELSIPVTREVRDGTSAEVQGKLSGDDVTISLKQVGAGVTEISVRVGLFGNENASRRIHSVISQKL